MKYLILVLLASSFITLGCNKNETADTKSSGQKNKSENTADLKSEDKSGGEIVEIQLPTIQCGTCKKNIETSVKKIDGINEVKVSVSDKVAKVNFDKTKTDITKIEGAIVSAGYQANDKPADKQAYDKLEACCKIGGHDN